MAGELHYQSAPGINFYAVIMNSSGLIAGNSAFEAQNLSHWNNYAIPLVDSLGSGLYIGDLPSWFPTSGVYNVFIRIQNGGSPTSSDSQYDQMLIGVNGIPVINIPLTVTATTLSGRRGDTWSLALSGLGNITARTKLWFTVKNLNTDLDTDAILEVIEGTGLTILNGSGSVTAGHASLTVTNGTTGAVTIAIAAAETAAIDPKSSYLFDVQMLTASGVTTLITGVLNVVADITRAVS